jgi:hypothetical protein
MTNKKTLTILFFLLSSLASLPVFAEYRVYQYFIRSKTDNINPSGAQVVTSTLNPRDYMAYNGGKLTIDLTLLRSWVCMGNTSHKTICDGPESKGVAQ